MDSDKIDLVFTDFVTVQIPKDEKKQMELFERVRKIPELRLLIELSFKHAEKPVSKDAPTDITQIANLIDQYKDNAVKSQKKKIADKLISVLD